MAYNDVRMKSASGSAPDFGAIFMSNRTTIEECFKRKLFGLPHAFAGFVEEVRAGMILFLYEYEQRKLYGVFQAVTDGTMDIIPHAYCSSGKLFPAQVRFKVIWDCHPLLEHEFRGAIKDNYFAANKFHFGLSKDQVQRMLCLFYPGKVRVQRSLTKEKVKRRRPNTLVDSGKCGLEKEDSVVESQARNSVGVLQSLNARIYSFQHPFMSGATDMLISVHEYATNSTGASANSSFSGNQSVPLQKESENVDLSSYTTSSGLGDYIPLSSPEHFDPTETGKALSEAVNLKDNQIESAIYDGYKDLSESCRIPIPFGQRDSNQPSSVFSPGRCDRYYQSSPVHTSENHLRFKSLYSDTQDKRTSVFSRLNLVSKAAVEENEDNSEVTESVHEIMEKLQQSHKNWKKASRRTKRIAREKGDRFLKKRASVFSRLYFASKDGVEEMQAEIFWEEKKKRGREVFIGSHDDGENFNMTIQVQMNEDGSQIEEDPDDMWSSKRMAECIPLLNKTEGRDCVDGGLGACLSEEQQKKRRLVRLMFTNESDVKAEISGSCLKVQMPSQESSAGKENGESCEGSTRIDGSDDNGKDIVPAVICPTISDENGKEQGKNMTNEDSMLREQDGDRKNHFSEVSTKPLKTYQRRLSASASIKDLVEELFIDEGQAACTKTFFGTDGGKECGEQDAGNLVRVSPVMCESDNQYSVLKN